LGIVGKSSKIPRKTAVFSIPRADGHPGTERPLSPLFVLARPVFVQISNVSCRFRARIGSRFLFAGIGSLGRRKYFSTSEVKDVRIEDKRWRDSDGRVAEAFASLGDELAAARDAYAEVKQLDETLFAKDYESL